MPTIPNEITSPACGRIPPWCPTDNLLVRSRGNLAALCSRREESFTQLPVQRIEQVIKPRQQQQDAFDKLKTASMEAANQLQASCPAELPQAPIDRFDAVGKRLDAMTAAVKTVRPALADFYSSLT